MLLASLATFAGCCPLTGPGGAGAGEDSSPDADEANPFVAAHSPEWDAAGFTAAFSAALSHGLPLPQTVFADYRELLGHGDGNCPTSSGSETFDVPHGCTSSEGYLYRGSAGILVSDTRVFASDGSWTGAYGENSAPANYTITRPDGERLSAGGTLGALVLKGPEGTAAEGVTTWSASITGTFMDDGQVDWLGPGYSGDLALAGSDAPDDRYTTIDGEISIGGVAVRFEALALDAEACPAGATGGSVSVRQGDSTWSDLTLADGCGTCGALRWNDEEDLGEACIDLAAVLSAVATCEAA